MIKYILENQNQLKEKQNEFYTVNNTHIYVKNKVVSPGNNAVDVKNVLAKIESMIPAHLLVYIEFIFVGWFDEFEKRNINSYYEDGTIYVSNFQDSEEDMIDDIVHEISHSLETPLGHEIYGDGKIEQEFIAKRTRLFHLLEADGHNVRILDFMNTEYNIEFDNFLYKTIGYDKLSNYIAGLMLNAYSATSIREYFAEAFQEFYLDSGSNYIQKLSPATFQKINELHIGFFLDK
tara:strand:+ start:21346 stop:22047 length:702 start_codon:yes stop_codon:yes gene_type:complete